MSTGHAAMKWFFCYRLTSGARPGRWVVQGPYATYERAKDARQKAKAWDAEVSVPFPASTKEEAQGKCDTDQIF
jgi:hypothetical protein